MKKILTNWGLYPRSYSEEYTPNNYESISKIISENPAIIARGNGRCYGDASLSKQVVSTLQLNKIIAFDELNGTMHCEAGVLLSDILIQIVPKGWFLPVVPGTKLITVGGAFASAIHGKNHHIDGVFSDHVQYIQLIDETGNLKTIYAGDDLFNQTAGGMGCTGIIVTLAFTLKKIETAYIRQTAIRAKNLQEIFSLFETHASATYSVAWIDCLAKGKDLGRSVLLLGEHASPDQVKQQPLLKVHSQPFLRVPFFLPSWFLHSFFINVFNFLFYFKPSSNSTDAILHYDPFFFPLDKINNWNKIYGQNGFIQYQFVLPKSASFEGIQQILQILAQHQLGSFLAVLKLFGKAPENNYLQFPMEGYTLALDIKISPKIWAILDELDAIVTNLGGKIYLTKDARLKGPLYLHQYPNRPAIKAPFVSNLSIRLQQTMQDVFLIIGANSDIAKQAALAYVQQYPNGHLILASRNTAELHLFVEQNGLSARSTVLFYNVADTDSAETFIQSLPAKPKWVLYAAGILHDNEACQQDSKKMEEMIAVNYTGAVAVLNALVQDHNPFLERIIGISSIAGLRGRLSNFAYGSTKSGFHQYLFGLRQQLKNSGIQVQAITPGVVATKMTAHLTIPGIAVQPNIVAASIIKNKQSFEVYPNLIWKIIAMVVKYAPEFVVKKL
jgi:FAD/FMN-containing dehydrogenase/short-subunit dehydrogenase